MNCTRYRKLVKRAALGSLEASRQARLDTHLAECAGCRGLLDGEWLLAKTIEMGLAASVSGLPSPDFTARVRVRLAEDSQRARPRSAWVRTGWFPISVAGIVALATLLAVIWPALRQQKQPQPVKQTARVSAPDTSARVVSRPSVKTDNGGAMVASGAAHARTRRAIATPERARIHESNGIEDDAPQFQVIVEPGQSRVILAAYRAAQSARVGVDALAQTSDADEQPQRIKPIEVNPVVVAELNSEESAKPTGN